MNPLKSYDFSGFFIVSGAVAGRLRAKSRRMGRSLNPGSRLKNQKRKHPIRGAFAFGAGGGTRTRTMSPPTDFESLSSSGI